ncbi:RING-type domain-containing protein [Chloropicon primus]|uniref:RING-type domain-containing protein n=1 Tax=Chloropicon primus TaxID=1764295 RepID=A0A5B8MKK3_9CHLO|nr:hypothetical protein A3770_04p35240 [Chloropicon primus]UPR00217.1 RING-type domain-containing protein [Chloropicon primus]|eukprot:QDZ21006.1 hypothetical protein A3770_04p35240 [Chloropicon primus]
MIELGTMLILGGCLVYSLFNALFFVFVYYRRRQLEREDGLSIAMHSPSNLLFQSVQSGFNFQVVPIEKPLSHNAWLHQVAMKHLCTSNKLVGIKSIDPGLVCRAAPTTIQPGDILLRIRNLHGPFTDLKMVTRFFHQNRKFDTPVLVYRFDQESCKGEILDLVIKPSTELLKATFEKMPVKTDKCLVDALKPKAAKQKDEVYVLNKHQAPDELDENFENTCGICFENYPNAILHPCKHRICVNCHNQMYVKSCPYCREPIKRCQYELLI